MQRQHIGFGLQGFYRIGSLRLKQDHVDSIALHRKRVLDFWDQHGLAPTLDAFNFSRRTLYSWGKALKTSNGLSGLSPKNRAPKRKRLSHWDQSLDNEIRRLRQIQPNLGKDKSSLCPFLSAKNRPPHSPVSAA